MMQVMSKSLFFYLFVAISYGQVAPTWITSPYVQADSKRVIDGDACNCKTNNLTTPTATMTFTTAFPAIPNLGFGITNYQGDDFLASEMFQINRTALTTTTFSVKMQISGFTHLWVVEVRYVGISKSFPHHLNSFDNVPVNYTKGALVNISTASNSMTTYQNNVNYTAQATASGLTYKYFGAPLANNKVLLFMTSIFLAGTADSSTPGVNNSVSLTVTATPMSTQTYKIYVTLLKKASITRLHFSMITFDQTDVQLSGLYLIVYDRIQFTSSGGFYSFPSQFLTNFMIGFTQFSSSRCSNVIHFMLKTATISGSYGMQMLQSVPRSSKAPIIRFNYTLFYLKTWICPTTTVFDPTTNLCVVCPLSNCLTCFNISVCSVCNQTNYYYLNSTSGLCQTCSIPGCVTCSGITTCSDCNQTLNYVISGTQTCTLCQQTLNYFANNATQTCIQCTLTNCINCSSLAQCSVCNTTNFYYVGVSGTCLYCDPALNYLIQPVTLTCQICTVSNCINCSTLTTCRTCAPGYLINTTDNLCYVCSLANCVTCSTFTTCSACNTAAGYTLNTVTNLCQPCILTGCTQCTTTTICNQCNTTQNYILVTNACQLCSTDTFANATTNTCEPCTLTNCISCLSLTVCQSCNIINSYYLSGTVCLYCNPSTNSFINTTSLSCQPCTVSNCINCSSLTTCVQCAPTYIINPTDGSCNQCLIANCLVCGPASCIVCDTGNGYALDNVTGLCQPCTLTACTNCSTTTTCIQCNTTQNYILVADTCQLCSTDTFANATTNTCQPCTLTNCITCLTLTTCGICNIVGSYYMNILGTCSYCDPNINNFINTTTLSCQTCSIPNCIICSSLQVCSVCNTTALSYMNTTDNLCYPCTITGCITCNDLYSCNLCNTASLYTINTGTGLCQICSLVGCINCTNTVTCTQCNSSANYVMLANSTCILCDGSNNYFSNTNLSTCQLCTLNQCTVCISLSICGQCNIVNSYYLDNGVCVYCNSSANMFINTTTLLCQACTLAYCTSCSSLTSCGICDSTNGYFMNVTDNLCYACTLSNCLTCYSLTNCSVCDSANGYTINFVTGLCQLCAIVGCVNCTDTLTCTQCNHTDNYILLANSTCQQCDMLSNLFVNTTVNTCQLCTLVQCTVCSSLSVCSVCNIVNLYYVQPIIGNCSYCDPLINNFINLTTLQCMACQIPNCLNCSSLTTCQQCNTQIQIFLNETTQLCQSCSIENCFSCQNLTMCSICDESSQFFLNTSSGMCESCTLSNCIICQSLTVCLQCDHFNNYGFDQTSFNASQCGPCNVSCTCDGYGFPWNGAVQQCTPICGDGLVRLYQQCDDNNLISGDGCSASCTIQIFYTCISQPSFCNKTITIDAQFSTIEKNGCNSFVIHTLVRNFDLYHISQYFNILNPNITITNKQQSGQQIVIYASYTRNIINQTILLQFTPGPLINITYSPGVPPLYYQQHECQSETQVQTLIKASQIISYIILIISILSCKIVGLELFGVLQLSYFTLSAHNSLNLYLSPLLKFKTFNGLNIGLIDESSPPPVNYTRMNVASSFINNCNIMLILLFAQLIVSFIIYIVGRLTKSKKAKNLGRNLLKQGFVTLVLFNIFNISFSAGVHLKYADPNDEGYLISSIILYATLAAMVISVFAMQITSGKGYGEFKSKFKDVWICRLYIPLTVCYRMALGFYTALKSDYQQGTLLILAFSLTFMLFYIVNLPFLNVFQNYRGGVVHITMLYTLLTTNFYQGMKSNTPIEVKGRMYAPAIIQLSLIVSCIVLSFAVLIYEIYYLIKNFKKKKIQQNLHERNQTEESIQQVTINQ